jgi:hypothetical protein
MNDRKVMKHIISLNDYAGSSTGGRFLEWVILIWCNKLTLEKA